MSSGKLEKNVKDIAETLKISKQEDPLNFADCIISFSKFFKTSNSDDIYSGNENIPFEDRNPEFKIIMKKEFITFEHS